MDRQPALANPRIRDVIGERVTEEVESGWLFDHRITAESRTAILRAVFLNGQPHWSSAFGVMLLLSAGVATLGLSENSAATIIGAMVIAPLGQPIVAFGAAAAMVWTREAARMLLVVGVGAAAVISTAYALALLMPGATPNEQILARTAPDLRDLGIALFAGAAGAYAYVRDELSGVLPGVAIAVALVPPLAVVGMMLEEGHFPLAMGALLLFVANFVGISVSACAVMLITGFTPLPRFRKSPQALGLLVTMILAIAMVAVPLGRSYEHQIETARVATAAHAIAQRHAAASGTVVRSVSVSGTRVAISVDDAGRIDRARLAADLRDLLGPHAAVTLESTR